MRVSSHGYRIQEHARLHLVPAPSYHEQQPIHNNIYRLHPAKIKMMFYFRWLENSVIEKGKAEYFSFSLRLTCGVPSPEAIFPSLSVKAISLFVSNDT